MVIAQIFQRIWLLSWVRLERILRLICCCIVLNSIRVCGCFSNSLSWVSLEFFLLRKPELITVWIRMSELTLGLFFEFEAITLVELLLMKHHFIRILRSTRHILVSMSHHGSLVAREKLVWWWKLSLFYPFIYIYFVSFLFLVFVFATVLAHVDTVIFCQLFSSFLQNRVLSTDQVFSFSGSFNMLTNQHRAGKLLCGILAFLLLKFPIDPDRKIFKRHSFSEVIV